MTSQNVLQIALVTGAACLFIGYIGCSLFDLYRKGGQRDLEFWLDAEVEQGIKLLNENEELRQVISTLQAADSFPAQESTSAGPDTALRAGGSSLGNDA